MILPKKWELGVMLMLATTLNYLDRQTLSILAPTLQRVLHLDNEALGWLFAIFYYTYTVAQVVVGPVLDRVNLRWAFLFAVLLWSLVSAGTGLAVGFASLLVFRLLLGVMEGANWPGALRVISRLMEPSERALGNGLFTSGTSVAALVAPALILGLSAACGWRWAFGIIGAAGALWAAGWLWTTRDRSLAHVWRDPAVPPVHGLAGQLAMFRDIARSPRFLPVLLVVVLVNPCLYFSVNWLPVYLVQQRGLTSGREMGWILTAIYLGLDLGNLAAGAGILVLVRRGWLVRQARRVTLILATLGVACCAAVPFLAMQWAVIALVLFNFGQGMWQTISLTMEQEVSPTQVSSAIGLLSGAGSLVGAIAMWAVGRITRETASFAIPMAAVGLAATLAAVAGWAASRDLLPSAGAAEAVP